MPLVVEGTLLRRTYQAAHDRLLVGQQLCRPTVEGADATHLAELADEWIVESDGEGKILAHHFPRAMSARTRNLLKSLSYTFQYRPAPDARSSVWHHEAADLTGGYRARYALQPGTPTRRRVQRSYDRYTRLFSVGRRAPRVSVDFQARITTDTRLGRLREIQTRCRRTLDLDQADRRVRCDVEGRLRLARTSQLTARQAARRLAALRARCERITRLGPEDQRADFERTVARQRRARLEGVTLTQLLRTPDQAQASELLVVLFEQRPATIAQAVAGLGELTLRQQGFVLGALASMRDNTGPRRLGHLALDHSQPRQVRLTAIAALSNAPQADATQASQLASLAGRDATLAEAALLAQGGIAYRMGVRGQTAARDRIAVSLGCALQRERSPQQRRTLLAAIGNAGSPRSLPRLQRIILDGSDPAERELALEALRRLRGPEVDRFLVRLISRPSHPVHLRIAALERLARRGRAPRTAARDRMIQAARQLALRDGSPAVRHAASLLVTTD